MSKLTKRDLGQSSGQRPGSRAPSPGSAWHKQPHLGGKLLFPPDTRPSPGSARSGDAWTDVPAGQPASSGRGCCGCRPPSGHPAGPPVAAGGFLRVAPSHRPGSGEALLGGGAPERAPGRGARKVCPAWTAGPFRRRSTPGSPCTRGPEPTSPGSRQEQPGLAGRCRRCLVKSELRGSPSSPSGVLGPLHRAAVMGVLAQQGMVPTCSWSRALSRCLPAWKHPLLLERVHRGLLPRLPFSTGDAVTAIPHPSGSEGEGPGPSTPQPSRVGSPFLVSLPFPIKAGNANLQVPTPSCCPCLRGQGLLNTQGPVRPEGLCCSPASRRPVLVHGVARGPAGAAR
ncbi:synapsin-1-like [Canis lupus familiaris]|uniref:synapsin-1-like n=1 Tax=Canis lupus familiaris TaxID=9615 RepID=UPI0018F5A774|nr:synapsin-1-like [Canis lupus familiaris]